MDKLLSADEMLAAIEENAAPCIVGHYYAAAMHEVLGVPVEDSRMGAYLGMLSEFLEIDMKAAAEPDDEALFRKAVRQLEGFFSSRGLART